MESAPDGTPRRKAAATKVKVVASRYAQTIQRTNLDAKTDRTGRTPVASSSSNAASIKVGSVRAATSKAAAQTRTGVVSSGTRTPVPSTPAVSTSSRGNSSGACSANSTAPMSVNDKLKLYRANKAAQRSGGAATAASADPFRSTARPMFPDRVTPPTEKAPPRVSSRERIPSNKASTPVKRRMTTPALRTTPATISTSYHTSTRPPMATASATATNAVASRVPTSTTEEELELLECMYVQLCFAEATATASFHRQEQSAERQMVTAWNILQSKLQLLHDTSIRLDRELHIRSVEEHLDDQAEPLVRLGSVITAFSTDLEQVTSALEASLQRMPTPGVICSPLELKRQLEGLSSTLEAFQRQLQSDGMGSTVADALSFTQGMEESTEQICALLLQVGHLLEEIQLEVNTETSLKAHCIQDARVQLQTQASEWW